MFNLLRQGSRWIIGNGESVHIGHSHWLPRPYWFKPILLGEPSYADQLVSELICKETGTWHEELVRRVLPIDADMVIQIPLCTSWPSDKLIWHFAANGLFSVRSAYHFARSLKLSSMASSSFHGTKDFWRLVWGLNVPPRIKLFTWRVGVSALPTRAHLIDGFQIFQWPVAYVGAWRNPTFTLCFFVPWHWRSGAALTLTRSFGRVIFLQ